MANAAARYASLQRNTQLVEQFCKKYGFNIDPLNYGYQLRIEGVIDIYPVNQKWHWLDTGERGYFKSGEDLRNILLKHLEVKIPPYIMPRPIGQLTRDIMDLPADAPKGYVGNLEGVMVVPEDDGEITIDLDKVEYAEQILTIANPEMFYKKPKWYQWRKRRMYRSILKTK